MKVRPCRRRHVAVPRPAARERQRSRSGRGCARECRAPAWRCGWRADRAPAGVAKKAQNRSPKRCVAGESAALELLVAPVPHQLRQRDHHRADALAAPAEGRGVRADGASVSSPKIAGSSTCAHRPGIGRAVSVAADRVIDRAVVHAGAAADAAEHLLILGAEHRGAAVVEDHDVVFVPARRDRPGRRGPVEKVV